MEYCVKLVVKWRKNKKKSKKEKNYSSSFTYRQKATLIVKR